MSAWAARPVYCLTLEISSYYWAKKSQQHSAAQWIHLQHNACIIPLQKPLCGPSCRYQLCMPVPGESYIVPEILPPGSWGWRRMVWKIIPRGCKNWSGRASKKGAGLIDKRSKDSAPFSLPFDFCHSSSSTCLFFCFFLTENKKVGKGLPWKERSQPLISSYSYFSTLFNFCV